MSSDRDDSVQLSDISSKLTPESLKTYLLTEFGPDSEFVRYNILTREAKGDSYQSNMYRIEVEGKSTVDEKKLVLHLIIKCLPRSIARRKTFRSVEFFRNEVAFYNNVIPALMSFQEKQKVKHAFTEFPKCFFAWTDGENDVVVMEDMSYKNYEPMNRQDGFTYKQCEHIVNMLGRFHALSFAMKDKEPEAFREATSSLTEIFYKPEIKTWYIDLLQGFSDIAIDAVSKEFPEEIYEEKLRQFTDHTLYERMIEYVKPKEPYAVICQGDSWAPNFLLCHADEGDGKVQKLCMIDYQLARYASPILDLSIFLYTCASEDVMFRRFDDILKAYYTGLSNFISELGSSAEILFPFKEFQKEIISYFAFGLGVALESVSLSVLDEDEVPDIDSISGDEAVPLATIFSLKPIKSKDGRIRVANNVKHAVKNGFI